MTTIKTPLPEKLFSFLPEERRHALKINEIILYLSELSEVVEGKMDNMKPSEIQDFTDSLTLGLKEQLLEEISIEKRGVYPEGNYLSHRSEYNKAYNKAIDDITAIINRVLS